MTVPSKSELQQLFDDETLATEAWTAEVVTSWPSLRILACLAREDRAATGELARAVNMDMRDVRDHLDALADAGLVVHDEDTWRVDTASVQFTLVFDSHGLSLSHSFDSPAESPETQRPTAGESEERADPLSSNAQHETEPASSTGPAGILARLRQRLSKLLGR